MMTPDPRAPLLPNGQPAEYLDGKILDCEDMLKLFPISVRTLQYWRSKGILPYSKIGNKIFYRWADVEEMLQRGRQAGKK